MNLDLLKKHFKVLGKKKTIYIYIYMCVYVYIYIYI